MARVARANYTQFPAVEVVETEFERWEPRERFCALVSVQAWHWIDPGDRYEKAHRALQPGATLAAIWTVPDGCSCHLRAALSAAYRPFTPELVPNFPMHPDSEPARLTGDWPAEIVSLTAFGVRRTRAAAKGQFHHAAVGTGSGGTAGRRHPDRQHHGDL